MWRSLIQRFTSECEFAPPVSPSQIAAVEQALGVDFPEDLRSLLAETNGVVGEYGLGLVWPLERIEADNLTSAFGATRISRDCTCPWIISCSSPTRGMATNLHWLFTPG